jgi:hypothetical protein
MCSVIVITNQDSTSSRLLPGSSYSQARFCRDLPHLLPLLMFGSGMEPAADRYSPSNEASLLETNKDSQLAAH